MFQQAFVGGEDSRKPLSFLVSFLSQVVLVCLALLIPLLSTADLQVTEFASLWLAAPPLPPAAPAPVEMRRAAVAAAPREVFDDRLITPQVVPERVAVIEDSFESAALETGSVEIGVIGSTGPMGERNAAIAPFRPAPPPKPPEKAVEPVKKPSGPVRMHSDIQAANLIRRVAPVYPRVAIETRTQGTVRLDAVIAMDGTIQSARVLSGHPLLVRAAMDAVKQWRYQPTLLNGEPVEVITQIEVNFRLR